MAKRHATEAGCHVADDAMQVNSPRVTSIPELLMRYHTAFWPRMVSWSQAMDSGLSKLLHLHWCSLLPESVGAFLLHDEYWQRQGCKGESGHCGR